MQLWLFIFLSIFLCHGVLGQELDTWSQSTAADFGLGHAEGVEIHQDGQIRLPHPLIQLEGEHDAPVADQFAERNSSGELVRVWLGNRHLFALKVDASRDPRSDTLFVTDRPLDRVAPAFDTAILDDGRFVIAWHNASEDRSVAVRVKSYDAHGNPLGDKIILEGETSTADPIVFPKDRNSVWIAFVGQLGERREVRVATLDVSTLSLQHVTAIPKGWNHLRLSSVARRADGAFLLLWQAGPVARSDFTDIFASLLDDSARVLVPPFKINDSGHGFHEVHPRGAFDEQGNAFIVWMDARRKTTDCCTAFDVFAQFYQTDGSRLGPNFHVRNRARHNVTYPDIRYVGDRFNVAYREALSGYRPVGPYRMSYWQFEPLASGIFVSSTFDTGSPATSYGEISWKEIRPAGTAINVQLRSGGTPAELEAADWRGPLGADFYTDSAGEDIHPAHNADRYIQYRVLFETQDPAVSPILDSVSVSYTPGAIPDRILLEQSYPNPADELITFRLSNPETGDGVIVIYDALGRVVDRIMLDEVFPGVREVRWRTDELSSGIYFYVLRMHAAVLTGTFAIVR